MKKSYSEELIQFFLNQYEEGCHPVSLLYSLLAMVKYTDEEITKGILTEEQLKDYFPNTHGKIPKME